MFTETKNDLLIIFYYFKLIFYCFLEVCNPLNPTVSLNCKAGNFNDPLIKNTHKKTVVLTRKKIRLMKNTLTLAALALTMAFTSNLLAQDFPGLDKSPMDLSIYPGKEPEKVVRVIYSRPQLKGRSLSDLAPDGKVWRTGANENTEITFYKDVTFGGAAVPAGTYSLFSIPGPTEWTLILNKNLNQWGAYGYDEKADLVRVKASATTAGESLDPFSIVFQQAGDGVHMIMAWGKTRVAVPITY